VHHLLRGLTLVLGDLHLEEASDIRSGEQVDLNLSRANPCSPRETERFGRRCVRACCIACGCVLEAVCSLTSSSSSAVMSSARATALAW
jgi:hypothetical protein